MKHTLFLFVLLIGTTVANAQSIRENVDKIDAELKQIERIARSLPPQDQKALMSSIRRIKQLTGVGYSSQSDNYDDVAIVKPNERILNETEFNNLMKTIDETRFFDSKLSLIKRVSRNTNFYMAQIKAILKTFNFRDERDQIRNIILPNVIDPENIRLLYDLYPFPDDQKELNRIMDQHYR